MKNNYLILILIILILATAWVANSASLKRNIIQVPPLNTNNISNTKPPVLSNINEAPTITLYGANPYEVRPPGTIPVCEGCPPPPDSSYKEPGYKATDKEDGDITSKVKITREIRDYAQIPKEYTEYDLLYTVVDSGGKTASAKRTIREYLMP